jgi:hypothetical protein
VTGELFAQYAFQAAVVMAIIVLLVPTRENREWWRKRR